MKSISQYYKKALDKMKLNKGGVFGLTSVQQFFAIILGVALLAYIIVVIMGTLQTASLGLNAQAANATINILGNVSNGVTGFFSAINPVYPILAILVIILVLVVLVRVTTGSVGGGNSPQL